VRLDLEVQQEFLRHEDVHKTMNIETPAVHRRAYTKSAHMMRSHDAAIMPASPRCLTAKTLARIFLGSGDKFIAQARLG
jgi:hypothetical protein